MKGVLARLETLSFLLGMAPSSLKRLVLHKKKVETFFSVLSVPPPPPLRETGLKGIGSQALILGG